MKFPDIVDVAALDAFDEIIDVRSPSEFVEDHIPGAISLPVLDDAERAEVGTLHKQASPFAAKVRGAALVSRNIGTHLERTLYDRPKEWRPLVYCWRGGKRSGAMKHILREIGWQAAALAGGYKAYRRTVVEQLASLPPRLRYRVVCGETGSAKSRLLEAARAAGAQVLDLEALANHRGSVLGGAPDGPQPAQRMFESRIWDVLRRCDPARPVLVESESKKVGELHVPDALIAAMRAAECVRVVAPVPARVAFLLREYDHFVRDPERLLAQVALLAPLYGQECIDRWRSHVDSGDWPAFVADLLEQHYDPAYRRSMNRNFAQLGAARMLPMDRLDAGDIAQTGHALAALD